MSGNQNEDCIRKEKVDKILQKLEKLDNLGKKIDNAATQVTEDLALICKEMNKMEERRINDSNSIHSANRIWTMSD